MPAFRPLIERFEEKVDRRDPGECWPWKARRTKEGYGIIQLPRNAGPGFAHRIAYEIAHGLIPEGMWVLHRCDNPSCVNPAHLFLGDNEANVADRQAKGRGVKGETCGQAKLTAEVVRAIRLRHAAGDSVRGMAREYAVSRNAVRLVVTGKTWRSVA